MSGYDNWKLASPWDDMDEWESGDVDPDAFYETLGGWRKDQVDALESRAAKLELMHKFWLEQCRDDWEAAHGWED